MALTYKARKRWSLVILIIGLPLYIAMAVTVMTLLYPDPTARAPIWVELGIYIGLGVLWAFPLKFIFKGIGQNDPDAK
ncbi:MAG: putative membrane channel-forming protein YqfA (hemolysin III family) [Paracoccaceae bacterium]|jgi:predicted membrane channel-forming protein YqfA (hemolysin III family)